MPSQVLESYYSSLETLARDMGNTNYPPGRGVYHGDLLSIVIFNQHSNERSGPNKIWVSRVQTTGLQLTHAGSMAGSSVAAWYLLNLTRSWQQWADSKQSLASATRGLEELCRPPVQP